MNLLALLDQLGSPASATAAPRRAALRHLGQAGARAFVAGLPLAAVVPAVARTTDTALDAITLLLKLEELQTAFYTQALAAPALAGEAFRPDLVLMLAHQQGHAAFLRQALREGGAAVPATPTFDFTGRRGNATAPVLFPDVFANVNNFLQLAQQLEDAGTAIYKSQAADIGSRPLLNAVLRMHAVEARHAAHIRSLRRTAGTRVKSWPSRTDMAASPAIQVPATAPGSTTSVYTFEASETQIVQTQAGNSSQLVPVPYATLLTGTSLVQTNALAEAFDEPLPTTQAAALLNIFG